MPRYLVTAGTILAGDPPRPGPTAFEVKGDRITWIGHALTIPAGAPIEAIDLGDATVIPGLIDAHLHLAHMALVPGWVDLRDAVTVEQVADAMSRAKHATPEGAWVVGWGFSELVHGTGRRLLGRHLDAAVGERPALVIHASFHSGVANSLALATAGFGRGTPRHRSGELERNARGSPNGRAWERALSRLEWEARKAEWEALGSGWSERLRAAARALLAVGLTHVGDAATSAWEREVLREAGLPLGVTAMPASDRSMMAKPADALAGAKTGEGDPRFLVGPLKLFADGAERCGMRLPAPVALAVMKTLMSAKGGPSPVAFLRMLKPRLRGASLCTGTLHYRPDELSEITRAARSAGLDVAVHAIGNEAIEHALAALESSGERGGRIEHAMFSSPLQAERMARHGITAVVQPAHVPAYGDIVRTAGIDAVFPPVPIRRLLDAGVSVALSSDGPTALWDPLEILRLAVERRLADGSALSPEQAPTRDEALRAATVVAAEASGVGETKGCIKVGRHADFTVLSGDPFDPGTRVLQTWVSGRKAYEAE